MKRTTPLLIIWFTALGCQTTEPLSDLKIKKEPEITTYLKSKRMSVRPGMDLQKTWANLVTQHDTFEKNKDIIDHCKDLDPEDGRKDPQCTCRIVPSCRMCDGGPVKCTANDRISQQYAVEKQRRTCLKSKGTQWQMYQISKGWVYGQCSCPDNRAFTEFVKDGYITNSPDMGRCATYRDICERGKKTFSSPTIIKRVEPDQYEAMGIKPGKKCGNLSISGRRNTVIKAWEDPKTKQCHIYELKGFERPSPGRIRAYKVYQSHQCK